MCNKYVDCVDTVNPCFDRRRVALGVVAPATHVAGDDGVGGGPLRRALAALAHDAHDAAIVGGRRAQQLQRRHRRPRVRAVAELDQAPRHPAAHLARVVVITGT